MNMMVNRIMAAVLASTPLPASAWWDWIDHLFSDSALNVSVSMGVHDNHRARYYDYYSPNWTYPDGATYRDRLRAEQPVVPTREPAPETLRRAIQAQRKVAEQWAADSAVATSSPLVQHSLEGYTAPDKVDF
jgi:hypothetical protein